MEPAPTISEECLWVQIIRPTQGDVDVISDQLVEQVLRHNRLVEEHCQDSDTSSQVGQFTPSAARPFHGYEFTPIAHSMG